MEQANSALGMLDLMVRPAFAAKDGIITYVNPEASGCMLAVGMAVADLLDSGAEEYAALEDGSLYLSVSIEGCSFGACVTRIDGFDIFILEQPQVQPELQAMALAARELREPLSKLLIAAERLLPSLDTQNPTTQQQAALLNSGLHQMLRQVGHMSDAARYAAPTASCQEIRDITAVIQEVFDKAIVLTEHTGVSISFTNLSQSVFCLTDSEKLERAIYNILSNAIKFATPDGRIEAKLTRQGSRLLLNFRDNGSSISDEVLGSIFSRHLRTPGIEEGRQGLGLGMVLIRSAAVAHGGTVLIQRIPEGGTSLTMTLAIRKKSETALSSPILRVDYAGGFDHGLVELADILPTELYYPNNGK